MIVPLASSDVAASAPPLPVRGARLAVEADIALRRTGKLTFRVRVRDISLEGCKAELVERAEVGELVWVRFDGIEALPAEVRWTAGFVAGLRFERPIHPAVFDRLAARMR